ncbi:hypothetical protein LUZ61_011753 [Rhynchospora tenuis]|uniref:DNA-3-methyladenine glycosylase I n=1 Tax=Rhynchospora tenuis TaxID=198213 RepID=A0AAD6A1S5_9POAL|nr:hypothetical protein LUZ61_011753 [Rhynchospora tenuis]
MSGAPRVRSLNIAEPNLEDEARPVLVPGGNKKPLGPPRKPTLKPTTLKPAPTQPDNTSSNGGKKEPKIRVPSSEGFSKKVLLKKHELLHSNLSLNASCSSDISTESFSSRASTGRIRRPVGSTTRPRVGLVKRDKSVVKLEKAVGCELSGELSIPKDNTGDRRRCAWITTNSESSYTAFHDEEWGVPVHDDKRLFELLVLCGALAELTWPEILSKRQTFREVFMEFDPLAVSKLNEKMLLMPSNTATSLLSEPKIRAIIENSRQILKIIEEFGSFDRYCWNFVNQKPVVNKFKYPRQVPVKSPKADLMSKDLIKRGCRCVGPSVVYSFMQVAGLTNDHIMSCFRFEECTAVGMAPNTDPKGEVKTNEDMPRANLMTIS